MSIEMDTMGEITGSLREQTMSYLLSLREDVSVKDSSFTHVLDVLSKVILHEDPNEIQCEIEQICKSKIKCMTCGSILESFEHEICGPCRLKDPRFKDEIDE